MLSSFLYTSLGPQGVGLLADGLRCDGRSKSSSAVSEGPSESEVERGPSRFLQQSVH